MKKECQLCGKELEGEAEKEYRLCGACLTEMTIGYGTGSHYSRRAAIERLRLQ